MIATPYLRWRETTGSLEEAPVALSPKEYPHTALVLEQWWQDSPGIGEWRIVPVGRPGPDVDMAAPPVM